MPKRATIVPHPKTFDFGGWITTGTSPHDKHLRDPGAIWPPHIGHRRPTEIAGGLGSEFVWLSMLKFYRGGIVQIKRNRRLTSIEKPRRPAYDPLIMQHGPWQILRSLDIYRDTWMHIRKDDVIRPDGAPGTHGVILLNPGVSVLPLDDQGRVHLTDEFHYAVGRRTIEVVSGGRQPDEPSLDAARRELDEELGITAGEWVDLGQVDPFTTMLNSPANLFLARQLQFGTSRPEATESIRNLTVDFDTAVEMVMDGRITHAPSCILILKAARWLEQNSPVARKTEI
jgi:ADP-ribose pyrophosphatase